MSPKRSVRVLGSADRDIEALIRDGLRYFERAGARLASLGWAVPMSLTVAEVVEIVAIMDPDAIDRYFVELFEERRGFQFARTLGEMRGRENLAKWKPLLRQAVSAYRRGHYLVVIPALLTVLEGVVMEAERGDSTPRKAIARRLEEAEQKPPGSVTLVLWRLTAAFVAELYRTSTFDGPHPQGLNRHWILHGRDVRAWDQADALRLFQAIDTLSSLLKREADRQPAMGAGVRGERREPRGELTP